MIVGIDRIEEMIAVCETDAGKQITFPISDFLPYAKEGNWYTKTGNKFVYDEMITQKKRDENAALLDSLLK